MKKGKTIDVERKGKKIVLTIGDGIVELVSIALSLEAAAILRAHLQDAIDR